MNILTNEGGVSVHANLAELTRVREQITVAQLALWGDHSSKFAAAIGLSDNHIADVIFNDAGLAVWAVANPEMGVAILAGLTAVWAQLANLNALVDLVQNQYQIGETTIDRKIGRDHQLLEVAATAPAFAKLNLGFTHDGEQDHHDHGDHHDHDDSRDKASELQDSKKLQNAPGKKGYNAQYQ
jgi:hypothetical protein